MSVRTERRGPPPAVLALGGYVAITVVLFGFHVIPHMTTVIVGNRADPQDPFAISWFLRWWPYALSHRIDPLVTHIVWAPGGFRLGGTTSVPGPTAALWPITITAGPVAAYNVAMLAAPALSAWSAFILCRSIVGRTWPAFAGGYVFGFSTYELGQLSAHLNLSLTFVVPLMALLVVLRLQGRVGPAAFVALEAAAMAAQFLIAPEILATAVAMGGFALLLVMAFGEPDLRRRALNAAGLLAAASMVAALAVSPVLIDLVRQSRTLSLRNPLYATDLANLVVPTPITLLHTAWTTRVAARFAGNFAETGSYVGLPLLVVAAVFATRFRRSRGAWLVVAVAAAALVASLGPHLLAAGHRSVPLPWAILRRLPLLRFALPERFMLYVFLLLGVCVAMLLADPGRVGRARTGMVALAVVSAVSLLPNVRAPFWHAPVPATPVPPDSLNGRTVLFVPFGRAGSQAMLWQAESGMSFRIAGGYLSCEIPPEYERWQAVVALLRNRPGKTNRPEMRTFLVAHHVEVIVLTGEARVRWTGFFASMGLRPRELGEATMFAVPSGIPLGNVPPPSAARPLNDCNTVTRPGASGIQKRHG